MSELNINILKEEYDLHTKDDFHASISEKRMENNSFHFFENPEKQFIEMDLYNFVAMALGFKNVIMTYKSYNDRNDIVDMSKYLIGLIKQNPVLNDILKTKKLYYCSFDETSECGYKYKCTHIYTENGIMMNKILLNLIEMKQYAEIPKYFHSVVMGKCLDYNDEDIEFFCLRSDFMDHLKFLNVDDNTMISFGSSLKEVKKYKVQWDANNRQAYLKEYNDAIKYIDGLKNLYQGEMSEHKEFIF